MTCSGGRVIIRFSGGAGGGSPSKAVGSRSDFSGRWGWVVLLTCPSTPALERSLAGSKKH